MRKILVVDDDAMNLKIAEIILKKNNYETIKANSGGKCLEYLENGTADLILLDVHMGDMDGFEVLKRLKEDEKSKEIPVIFLTADNETDAEIRGLKLGAYDFITKPFVAEIMIQRIERILEYTHLQKHLKSEVKKQTQKAEERWMKLEHLTMQVMLAFANTIDAKDQYTNGHSMRVAEYAKEIARRAGKTEKEQEDIYFSGLLHDIGKIGVPDEIINKAGRLSDEEYAVIKSHPAIGGKILMTLTEIPGVYIGANWHHERFDGKGYPDGLKGEEIPEIARIIAVADSYDAMTSKRPYRGILSQDIVKAEVEKGKGSQFDPYFAEIMIQMIEEDTDYQMCGMDW
uniref:HD domain-containing phosphohydrolase n=1 Tax=Agathobacter sp. TaxID=2021311 RepID=UPI004057C812